MQFIYRATYSDGTVKDTAPRVYRFGGRRQPSLVKFAQLMERRRSGDQGLIVVRLVREVRDDYTGPWKPDTHPDFR